jgi:ribosome-associated protein
MTDPDRPTVTEFGPDAAPAPESRSRSQRTPQEQQAVRDFIVEAARLMSDLHCSDIVIYDVHGLSAVTDYIIIASGTSDRQIRSVADDLSKLAKDYALERFGRDEDAPSKWIVIDFIDVIVHLFEPNTRAYYDLEMMWGDAPTVAWERERDKSNR